MYIQHSQTALQASHQFRQRDEHHESLRAWVGQRPGVPDEPRAAISDAARRLWSVSAAEPPPAHRQVSAGPAAEDPRATREVEEDAEPAVDPELSLVRRMIEMLTGEKIRVFDARALEGARQSVALDAAALEQGRKGPVPVPEDRPAGYGIEYDAHTVHEEFEQTDFSARGRVVTAEGKTFDFSLDLRMTRHYSDETRVSYREGDAVRKDPLVINFGGTAAQLSRAANQTFRFDLDRDGNAEDLPLFASGSGYLALDLNRSGTIDDAGELFGPETGNGFAELARLDEDGNGWIDEGDRAFDRLQVWTPGAGDTAGTLRSLADLDVGAISLTRAQTPFALRDNHNTDLGVIRDTGVYLTNQGKPGSLQEIDVTV